MKKWAMALALATVVLGACGTEKEEVADQKPVAAEVEKEEEVDAASELIEVIIPADFTYDIEEEPAMKEVFEDITVNNDDSVTYTNDEALYAEFMAGLTDEFDIVIDEIVNTYPSFQLIEYTGSYDEFNVHLDASLIEDADEEGLVKLVALAGTYNGFNGVSEEDISIAVNLIDADTKEIVETLVYPE